MTDDAGITRPSSAAAAVFAGFALLAVADAVAIAVAIPLPPGGRWLRVAHYAFDAGETLGVGMLAALVVGAVARFARLPSWAPSCLVATGAMVLVDRTIGEALLRFASELFDGKYASAIVLGLLVLLGAGFPVALHVARLLSRHPRLRPVPVALAIGALIADFVLLPEDYVAIHCVVAWGAAMIGGVGLAPLVEGAVRRLRRSRSGLALLGAIGLFGLFGVAWPPPNATRFELFRQPCAVAPWVLATTLWRSPSLHAPVVLPPSRWDEDRSKSPPVPPTSPPLLPPDAVVVLITIDALRADVVSDAANDALLPAFAELKRDGVYFTHASAPGSQTPCSLSPLFSGLYFSEQRWTDHGVGDTRFLYPADDPSPRFPELLSGHGVRTANYASLIFLGGEFGVVGHFQLEKVVAVGRIHAEAKALIDPLLEQLKQPPRGPFFLYTHLTEPHWPYDRGRKDGTDYERYVSEVAVADAAVGRVLRRLSEGFGRRWALIVTADHGEAFGEHQTTGHTKTLYEELLHVPLLARSPLFPPRTIDARVGLIDLGPTILDLFGVATPATFNGESLVPILAGGAKSFTRPLIAEGRLRQALTQPDGLKVINDPLRKVVEAYDLVADPGETRNLFDLDPARVDPALAALRAFFAVHTLRGGGYETPYRP